MRYLQRLFDQELEAEYPIEIAGETFLPQDILKQLAPKNYEIAYSAWKDDHTSTLLEKSESIFDLHDNHFRFQNLRKAFKSGSMVPFVGAGMSIPSRYPSWTGFLQSLTKNSHVPPPKIEELLANGHYEDAAQVLYEDLGPALFNEKLEATFSTCDLVEGPLNYLPVLFPRGLVLTTNFDSLVERVYEEQGKDGFDRVISGKAMSEVLRQMSAGARLLVKMHGDCRQIRERVLLRTEYDTLYRNKKLISQFFSKVIFRQSLLFLGCQLSNDRTIRTMKDTVRSDSAATLPRHYAILELRAKDDRIAREKHLSEANIFPIWYPENEHDVSIEALFMSLVED